MCVGVVYQVGNSKGLVKLYNVSTGKLVKGGNCKTAGAVLCMTLEPTGSQLWVGDSKVGAFNIIIIIIIIIYMIRSLCDSNNDCVYLRITSIIAMLC